MAPSPGGVKNFQFVFGGIAVIGLGILAWLVFSDRGAVAIPVDVAVMPDDTAGFSGYYLGSDSAPVVITEYADYQCPGCQSFELQQFGAVRRRLIETGKVRWRYRDFPLDDIHPHTRLAAHSAACAEEQGKYWEQHSSIYEHQLEWSGEDVAADEFRGYAEENGLDGARYEACMQSARYAGRIEASRQEALRLGVQFTPSFVIGNQLYSGGQNSDFIEAVVDSIIKARSPQ